MRRAGSPVSGAGGGERTLEHAEGVFPFGRPVLPCVPSAVGERPLFVLGAYPSALHVRWSPPRGAGRTVRAVAVDNEPTPFWDGADEADRFEAWLHAVGWQDAWGTVAPVRELNGSSGRWVRDLVLAPLQVEPSDAWITDCLDTYRMSTGMARALESVYRPFAAAAGLPPYSLRPHPSEAEIVRESSEAHRTRLEGELRRARPSRVVTLGNAALRTFRGLIDAPGGPRKLTPGRYASPISVEIERRPVEWLPLAHPASPRPYQEAHAEWTRHVSQVRG